MCLVLDDDSRTTGGVVNSFAPIDLRAHTDNRGVQIRLDVMRMGDELTLRIRYHAIK